jgi:hypothetical protein
MLGPREKPQRKTYFIASSSSPGEKSPKAYVTAATSGRKKGRGAM